MSQCVSKTSQGLSPEPPAADTTTSPARSLPALTLAALCDRELPQPTSSSTASAMAKAEKGEALLLLPGRLHRGPLSGKALSNSPALAVGFVATSTMDGAWVGTWRPHRPRGPIMAQFTSPGPKYSIPGTTGYLDHNPTKTKAPAYTFRGAKPPVADSCSPGPRYYVPPSITRNGKYVAPAQHICGLPKIKTEITPGPSDYSTDKANKHLYKCAPAQSMAFRHKAVTTDQTPGPGTYTLPRLVGPNTAYTHASPCYSLKGKSKHRGFAEDLSKTPGPAAFPKVELDVYKKRAPMYTMGTKSRLAGDKTVKPGPADYCLGKVRQPARLSSSAFDKMQDAGLLPCLGPKPSRGRPKNISLPLH
ncbi:ciliary microtubule associated protein 1A-like [Mycteria americana]|uniref:ciliary microtubule associated protein 1A-like n=1 Tax=Mycteria americana TaxID=33587 RepID=UPI003F58DFD7